MKTIGILASVLLLGMTASCASKPDTIPTENNPVVFEMENTGLSVDSRAYLVNASYEEVIIPVSRIAYEGGTYTIINGFNRVIKDGRRISEPVFLIEGPSEYVMEGPPGNDSVILLPGEKILTHSIIFDEHHLREFYDNVYELTVYMNHEPRIIRMLLE